MRIKYRIDLTDEEREHLLGLIGKGKSGARTLACEIPIASYAYFSGRSELYVEAQIIDPIALCVQYF